MGSGLSGAKRDSFLKLDKLLEGAEVYKFEPDNRARRTVDGIFKLQNNVKIDGETHGVDIWLRAVSDASGEVAPRYYLHSVGIGRPRSLGRFDSEQSHQDKNTALNEMKRFAGENQGDIQFKRSRINPNDPDAMEAAAMEAVSSIHTRNKQAFFDIYAPLQALEKLVAMSGKALDASVSAWKAALFTRNLGQVVTQQVERGALAWNAGKGMFEVPDGRKGLKEIFKPVTGSVEALRQWENWAKAASAQERALRLSGEKEWSKVDPELVSEKFPFSKQWIDEQLQLGRARPEFASVMNDYRAFMKDMRQMLVDTGMISVEAQSALEEMMNYVPFHRDMRDVYHRNMGTKRAGNTGLAGQGNVVQRMSKKGGGDRDINPLLENIVAQVSFWSDAAMKNVAMSRAVRMMEHVNLAEKDRSVRLKPVRVKSDNVIRELNKVGANLHRATLEELGDMMELFTYQAPNEPNVLSVSRNGQKEWYRIKDPSLVLALNEMGAERVGMATKIFKLAKEVKTRGVTATPQFAVSNLIRDTLSTWVMYGKSYNLAGHMGGVIRQAANALGVDQSGVQQMGAAGAGGSMYRPVGRENVEKSLVKKSLARRAMVSPVEAFRQWEKVLNALENANRLQVRAQVLKKGGTEAEANFQAMDLLNFGMRGAGSAAYYGDGVRSSVGRAAAEIAKVMGHTVPFLNARMQGLYKLERRFEEDAGGVALRGSILSAATVALWALNYNDKDEDGEHWYRKLKQQDKLLFYHFRLPGSNDIIKVPKPFEFGAVFSSLPELFMNSAAGDAQWSEAAQGVGKIVLDIFALNPLSNPVLQVPVEQWANKTMFFDSPIVPADKLE